jgi:hypothetical protein
MLFRPFFINSGFAAAVPGTVLDFDKHMLL